MKGLKERDCLKVYVQKDQPPSQPPLSCISCPGRQATLLLLLPLICFSWQQTGGLLSGEDQRTKKSDTGETGQRWRLTSFSCPSFRMFQARLIYYQQETTKFFSGKMKWPKRNATKSDIWGYHIKNLVCHPTPTMKSTNQQALLCRKIYQQLFNVSLFTMNRQLKFIRQLSTISNIRANNNKKRILRKEVYFLKIITINILRQIREEFASMKKRCHKKIIRKHLNIKTKS